MAGYDCELRFFLKLTSYALSSRCFLFSGSPGGRPFSSTSVRNSGLGNSKDVSASAAAREDGSMGGWEEPSYHARQCHKRDIIVVTDVACVFCLQQVKSVQIINCFQCGTSPKAPFARAYGNRIATATGRSNLSSSPHSRESSLDPSLWFAWENLTVMPALSVRPLRLLTFPANSSSACLT